MCRTQLEFNPMLNSIWHSRIPLKISILGWRLLRNLLPVDTKLRDFGIYGPSKCQCCMEEESTDHVFLHSPPARKVWSWFQQLFDLPKAQYTSIHSLLQGWCSYQNKLVKGNLRIIVAMVICWAIWLARNSSKHERIAVHPWHIIQNVEKKIRALIHAQKITSKICLNDLEFRVRFGLHNSVHQQIKIQYTQWLRPKDDWIKLNIDGCSKGNPGMAGAGGLFRDSHGNVICSFYMNLGLQISYTAELMALLQGIKMISALGLSNVWIEADSLTLVNQISHGHKGSWNNHMYFSRIYQELYKVRWKISHIWREANAAADYLANLGLLAGGMVIDPFIHKHGILKGITILDKRECPYIRRA